MDIDTPLLTVVGVCVVLLTFLDLTWTAIAVGGRRGPLSDIVSRGVAMVGQAGRPSHRRRAYFGVATAAAVPLVWLLLLWAGFALMFLSDEEAVVIASSQQPTGALGRVAYAAGGLAGAGAGLQAGTEAWQLVNNVAALAGLALVTLGLTYLMQVVSGVVNERSTMSEIAALAASPDDPSPAAADGGDQLPWLLLLIAEGVSMAAQRHLAFPMLQFFHSTSPSTSASVNVARLQLILDDLERQDAHRHATVLRVGRSAIDDFLGTLRLPAAAGTTDLTRRTEAFLHLEGWDWDDVAS